MYKKAIQQRLRYVTLKGELTTEQLWGLSQKELSDSIKAVKKILKKTDNDDELSFLEDTNKVTDTENTLRFDILKDVYLTKQLANQELRNAKLKKGHNDKIYAKMEENK
jgi:hypothetical protein